MARPVRTQKFRGKKYRIDFVANLGKLPCGRTRTGLCDPPHQKDKTIKIKKGLSPKETLEILIHEGLHACYWDTEEDAICEAGESIAEFLWRLGYRRVECPSTLKLQLPPD